MEEIKPEEIRQEEIKPEEIKPEESMDDERVNRCECVHKTFEQLKAYESFDAAQAATGCGTECEGCMPYVKLMFASGETSFDLEDPRLADYA